MTHKQTPTKHTPKNQNHQNQNSKTTRMQQDLQKEKTELNYYTKPPPFMGDEFTSTDTQIKPKQRRVLVGGYILLFHPQDIKNTNIQNT